MSYATLPNCCRCGRFCVPVDQSTNFGHTGDLEPPDDEYYCKRCARREENDAVKTGRVPSFWRNPSWAYRAAKRLGLVLAGPRGAAWAEWFPKDKVPQDYNVW